ncbi:hypothetical protein GCM10022198_06290 [Klugiella xanthotipulae]|uniref:Uroporphyrinogen-III synthase n=1 Tax=Klugiella xanthotipulae TaxID=244735 RepID=A0A543I5W3_9MICO|nr:uroporphyrinogen-III synthase [Klugiella xanthotipulae]TQM65996.1 uroporphyrinogen-III synthase [Klugiella xanthotipulae]
MPDSPQTPRRVDSFDPLASVRRSVETAEGGGDPDDLDANTREIPTIPDAADTIIPDTEDTIIPDAEDTVVPETPELPAPRRLKASLYGRRILLPRGGEWGRVASEQLKAHGATPLVVPLIATAPTSTPERLDAAIQALRSGGFDWLVVASASAVPAIAAAASGLAPGTSVAAVGQATADALNTAGFPVHLVPQEESSAKALVTEWPPTPEGARALLLQSQLSPAYLGEQLAKIGMRVATVEAYQTVPVEVPGSTLNAVTRGFLNTVFVTSRSVAQQVAAQLMPLHPDTLVVCIGESSATACRELGIPVSTVSKQQSVPGMLTALTQLLTSTRPS